MLLSYHLLGQFLHLIQTVQLSLQVFLKLSLFPPQSLHLCHRVLFGHHRGLCQSSPTSVGLLGPTYPQDLGVRLTPRLRLDKKASLLLIQLSHCSTETRKDCRDKTSQ